MSKRKQVLQVERDRKFRLVSLSAMLGDMHRSFPGYSNYEKYEDWRREEEKLKNDLSYWECHKNPKNVFWGEKRITHKYVNGWKDEDEWEGVGLFTVLSESGDTFTDKYGDSWSRTMTIKAPRGASQEDVEAVLNAQFDYGCRCEHDCCGHVQSYGSYEKHLKRREHLVTVHYYRNV